MDEPFDVSQGRHTLYLRPPVWLPITVALIVGGMYVTGKAIEARDRTPTIITVSGEGEVTSNPDIAEISFGVQTGPQTSSRTAMQKLERDMSAVLAAVKELGIEEKDIRTQQLYLSPMYDWNDGKQTLRGYEANQQLTLKVRDLDKVGELLMKVADKGANQIGGVIFTIDNPDAFRARARKQAIEEAQAKALVLARDLGMKLGKLKGFSEGGDYIPPMPYTRGIGGGVAMDAAEKAIEVPAGEQEVKVNVSLNYELR